MLRHLVLLLAVVTLSLTGWVWGTNFEISAITAPRMDAIASCVPTPTPTPTDDDGDKPRPGRGRAYVYG